MQLKLLVLTVLASALLSHCKQGDDPKADEASAPAAAGRALDKERTAADVDYPKDYCEFVTKIQLRANPAEELGFFCKDGKPTKEFLQYRELALTQVPDKYEIRTLKMIQDPEKDRAEYWMIWAFHVPIRPFEVKARPLYTYVSQNFNTGDIDFKGSAVRRNEEPDHGLHLWSVDMSYSLKINATATKILANERRTQYNLYQVQSGNEEMGFGVDALTDKNNPDFSKSILLNISFNDGKGYNDGKGGTVVIGYLHIETSTQGFPAFATKSIYEVAKHAVDDMYKGLQPLKD